MTVLVYSTACMFDCKNATLTSYGDTIEDAFRLGCWHNVFWTVCVRHHDITKLDKIERTSALTAST